MLWEKTDEELRKVILSSVGPSNGAMWIIPTRSVSDLLLGAHFMTLSILSLACVSNITGRPCALLKFGDDLASQCAQPMDCRLHHALTYKAGLARMRQH